MNLRKWRTNSKELLKTIPIDLRETKKVEITTAPSDQAKALGVHWDTDMDTMHVSTQVDVLSTATKRQVASTIARIFDLMGWYAPAIIPQKSSFNNCGNCN